MSSTPSSTAQFKASIMRRILLIAAVSGLGLLTACDRPADVASRNLSYAADNFQVVRRIVFLNGITDKYILAVEGLCSLGNYDSKKELTVTCKTGPTSYKKHFLGLSDNVTFFAEQIDEGTKVDTYYYKVAFRPQTIVPDVDLDISR